MNFTYMYKEISKCFLVNGCCIRGVVMRIHCEWLKPVSVGDGLSRTTPPLVFKTCNV